MAQREHGKVLRGELPAGSSATADQREDQAASTTARLLCQCTAVLCACSNAQMPA
jgi:hypothetical protein